MMVKTILQNSSINFPDIFNVEFSMIDVIGVTLLSIGLEKNFIVIYIPPELSFDSLKNFLEELSLFLISLIA